MISKKNKKLIIGVITTLFFFLNSSFYCNSQNHNPQTKIRVGIWEFFDAKAIPVANLFVNMNEIRNNQMDDDHDGYIDNIHGIGFDYLEQPTNHNFLPTLDEIDLYFHGTAVADVILRNNPNVELVGCGFLRYVERAYNEIHKKNLLERLKGPNENDIALLKNMFETSLQYFRKMNVKVVNISWAASYRIWKYILPEYGLDQDVYYEKMREWTDLFHACLEGLMRAYDDIFFVIGAGNEGEDIFTCGATPAKIDLPNTITVGGLQRDGKTRSKFSNYGDVVKVYATAEYDSLMIFRDNKNQIYYYREITGTSFAAPVVTAYVAKLIEKGKSFREIKKLLISKKYFVSTKKPLKK